MMYILEELRGKFWTHYREFLEDIEELGEEHGFIVIYEDGEQIYVDVDDEEEYVIKLVVAGRTIAIMDIKQTA